MGKSILRIMITILCLVLQLAVINIFYYSVIHRIPFIGLIYSLLCLYGVLMIIKNSNNYSFTLPWIIIFLLIPIPGSILFLVVRNSIKRSKLVKNIIKNEKENSNYLIQNEKIDDDSSTIKYLSNYAGFSATKHNKLVYYPLGDDAFETMISELKKAEKFIFFEYFIVSNGIFWEAILEVLEEKAKAGVEVRVMYDDFGCLTTLESDYYKELEKRGIKSFAFNPFKALSGAVVNNRDHRKILVIDGKVAFSGGINIADEYINMEKRFGHWKDNCIMVKGDAVWNYTVMFLTMWNAVKNEDKDYKKYKYEFKNKYKENGYLVPYSLNPFKRDSIGEDVYLNIINQAQKYVYIFTPYLVIDHNMFNSLIMAVKRGVDVCIVVPNIPDKKIVFTVTESYVDALTNNGVKVYKYTPGFIHSKVFVSDDIKATVGTINLDYRSLFFHFECGCYIEKCDAIKDIKKDADKTIASSTLVPKKKVGKVKSFWQSILRLFAPLM